MAFSKKTITSNLSILVLFLLMAFLGDLKYKQYKSEADIEKQTKNLQDQANAMQKQNDDLNQSLQYLSSTSFKERVARQQLNYKRDGELVYGFTNTQGVASTQNLQTDQTPNIEKWWNYFFTN